MPVSPARCFRMTCGVWGWGTIPTCSGHQTSSPAAGLKLHLSICFFNEQCPPMTVLDRSSFPVQTLQPVPTPLPSHPPCSLHCIFSRPGCNNCYECDDLHSLKSHCAPLAHHHPSGQRMQRSEMQARAAKQARSSLVDKSLHSSFSGFFSRRIPIRFQSSRSAF